MKQLRIFLLALVLVLFTIVIFRNLEETDLELVFTTITMPLAALLSITLACGFALGFFVRTFWKVRSWRNHKKKAQNPGESASAEAEPEKN